MYTKLDDMAMMKKIRAYVSDNPSATLKDVYIHCLTNHRRLKLLKADGYEGIPEPMPRGIRNKKYYEDKAIQQASA